MINCGWANLKNLTAMILAAAVVGYAGDNAVSQDPTNEVLKLYELSCHDQCSVRFQLCEGEASGRSQACERQYDSCYNYCNAGGSGPYSGRVTEGEGDCLPGETRNELGICTVNFRHKTAKHPNCVPGPNDDCRIRITLAMVPKENKTFVVCTGILMPMPGQPACRPATPASDELGADGCPKGMVKGPDDRCVPVIRPGAAGEYDRMVAGIGNARATAARLRALQRKGREAGLWFETSDQEETVRLTLEALGDQWERD